MTQFYSKPKCAAKPAFWHKTSSEIRSRRSLVHPCLKDVAVKPQKGLRAKLPQSLEKGKIAVVCTQHSRKYKLVYCPRSRDGLVQGHFQLSGTRRPVKGGNGHCIWSFLHRDYRKLTQCHVIKTTGSYLRLYLMNLNNSYQLPP